MRALLTGATGFIGQNLVKKLIENDWEVSCVVRNTSKVGFADGRSIKSFTIGRENDLRGIVKEARPDVVFHLASLFLTSHTYADIDQLIESNILFGTKLLEAMTENGICNFINTGSYWQHYQNETYNPVNLYAASKEAFLDIIKFYQETTPLRIIDLELFDTYGKGDTRRKILALLKETAEKGETLKMSPGEQLMDIVHVDDVAEAFIVAGNILARKEYEKCGTYGISSGSHIRLRDLVAKFEEISGKRLNISWGERPYRDREVMVPWNTYKPLPGWKAKISLEDGIRSLL